MILDILRRYALLIIALVSIWGGVLIVSSVTSDPGYVGPSALLAMMATIGIGVVFALVELGVIRVPEQQHAEKAKRVRGDEAEARLAVLLSLMTPEERSALTARLAGEMEGDGEIVSLGDLLAEDTFREAS